MLRKLILFGAGYVLGARAGRARYNQIATMAQAAARRLDDYAASNGMPVRSSLTSSRPGSSRSGRSGSLTSSRIGASRSGRTNF
jgi:hypothetical protein